MLRHILRDFCYSARALRKNPAFTVIAVVVLALGIGANTAIFSIVDVLLFRPLPVQKPEQLMRIYHGETRGDAREGALSYPAFQAYRDGNTVFSGLAAYIDRFPVNASVGKFGSERVDAGMVTGNYFQVLGIPAAQGRTITADDDKPDSPPVAMLGHDLWRRHFPAGSNAVGSQMMIDGQWFTIVGVAPASFAGVTFENLPVIWMPMTQAMRIDPLLKTQIPLGNESFGPFGVVGRIKPGVSQRQAQSQLETLAAQRGAGKPIAAEDNYVRPWPVLIPLTDAARQSHASFAYLLLGIVMLVLLIACADVAGLILARSQARQKEIAVRLALGGQRYRIILSHLADAILVSVGGAVLGCFLAAWGSHALIRMAPSTIDLPLERASAILNGRVLIFTAVVALLSAILSSMVPALKYCRMDAKQGIRGEATASVAGRRFSLQSGLVVMQVAACVLLLVGAGLLTHTLRQASQIHLGFDPDHTAFASTDLIRQGYDKNEAALMLDPLLDSLRAQPGVEAAALGAPPMQFNMVSTASVEGRALAEGKRTSIELSRVSPGYFNTVGIPILSGRDFKLSDSASAAGVALVNDAFARRNWPNENPIGKHLSGVGIHEQTFEVVGVVANTAGAVVRKEVPGVVYFPLDQSYMMFPWQPDLTLLARGQDADQTISAIRRAVASVNPALPLFRVRTLRDQVNVVFAMENFMARLLQAFSLIALLLAVAGVFGLMAYNTARRKQEFGIRMALGAQRSNVLWLVLKKGLWLTSAGLVIGLTASYWLTRVVANLLFGVSQHDTATYVCVSVLILGLALVAGYLPARRATLVDPQIALRSE
ncbi:MAG TPA: ABC transporter permease [Candidatus Angelobacter sp.]|nr:ABC transporter permease [Candidatus Angelobacter sp.]